MTTQAEDAPSHPWVALQATLSMQLLASMVLGSAPVLAPAVAPALGLPPERVGLFMAVAYLSGMLSGLGASGWMRRLGPARLSQLLLLAMAAGATLSTAGHSAMLLFGAASLMGIGYGSLNPAAAVILGRHAPAGSPGLFFAIKQAGVPMGIALAGLLMPLGLMAVGWRATAWLLAATCLIVAVALVPAARRLDARHPRAPEPAAPGWTATLMGVLRQPQLRRLSFVSLAYCMVQQGFVTFVVSLLHLELHLALALAAGLLAASQAACTIVRIALGHVADRWVTPRVLLGTLGLAMGASCLVLALLPRGAGLAMVAVAVVTCGATAMGWNGVYFAQLLRSVPREALAASAGGTQFFTFAGGMLGPFLFGQLVHLGGSYSLGYACLAVVGVAGGLAMLRLAAVPARAPIAP